MELASDFIDFIILLNRYEVAYIIVSGYAVMAHGQPRFAEYLDIWIKPSEGNAAKVIEVLKEFGFALKGLSNKDFEFENMVVQLGYPPLRIDLMSSIDGVTFEEAYKDKSLKKLGDDTINFIGLRGLIKNKESSGRKKDILDAEQLKKLILKKN